jgi:8-oxo-dGTP diphosphatase
VEACAARELAEETGLVAGRYERGPWTSDVFERDGRHYVTLFVMAHEVSGEPLILEPDKCAGWQWFDPTALPAPLFQPLATLLATGWQPG